MPSIEVQAHSMLDSVLSRHSADLVTIFRQCLLEAESHAKASQLKAKEEAAMQQRLRSEAEKRNAQERKEQMKHEQAALRAQQECKRRQDKKDAAARAALAVAAREQAAAEKDKDKARQAAEAAEARARQATTSATAKERAKEERAMTRRASLEAKARHDTEKAAVRLQSMAESEAAIARGAAEEMLQLALEKQEMVPPSERSSEKPITLGSSASNISKDRLQRSGRRLSFLGTSVLPFGGGKGTARASTECYGDEEEAVEEFELDTQAVVSEAVDVGRAEREARQELLRRAEEERRISSAQLTWRRFRQLLPEASARLTTKEDWESFSEWVRRQDFFESLGLDDYVECFDEWSSSAEHVQRMLARNLEWQRRLALGQWKDVAEREELHATTRALTSWLKERGARTRA